MKALSEFLRPEFLSRVDEIIIFQAPTLKLGAWQFHSLQNSNQMQEGAAQAERFYFWHT